MNNLTISWCQRVKRTLPQSLNFFSLQSKCFIESCVSHFSVKRVQVQKWKQKMFYIFCHIKLNKRRFRECLKKCFLLSLSVLRTDTRVKNLVSFYTVLHWSLHLLQILMKDWMFWLSVYCNTNWSSCTLCWALSLACLHPGHGHAFSFFSCLFPVFPSFLTPAFTFNWAFPPWFFITAVGAWPALVQIL